jgi:hypothetical protein
MSADDDRWLNEHTRLVSTSDQHRFEVLHATGARPVEPEEHWRPFRIWKRPPDAARLQRAGAAVLKSPRHVRRCEQCRTLTLAGESWGSLCTPCAEALGVRF